jgi:hypothetical protein
MADGEEREKIGGEYGQMRAIIDIKKLQAYLANNVEVMAAPIQVKQFKA